MAVNERFYCIYFQRDYIVACVSLSFRLLASPSPGNALIRWRRCSTNTSSREPYRTGSSTSYPLRTCLQFCNSCSEGTFIVKCLHLSMDAPNSVFLQLVRETGHFMWRDMACNSWKNREPVSGHAAGNYVLCFRFLWLHQWCSVTQLPCVDLRVDYINRCCIWPWPWSQFSRIIAPLFDSYNNMVSTASFDEVCRTTLTWLDQHCSLVALRPGQSIVFGLFSDDSQSVKKNFLTFAALQCQ